MSWIIRRGNLFWTTLIVSLAFNAGFGTTYGVRTYERHCRSKDGGRERFEGGWPGDRHKQFSERLKLTPEQDAQFTQLREQMFAQSRELWGELRRERDALTELLAAAEPDRTLIDAQVETIAELQKSVQVQLIDHLLAQRKLLTPEQYDAFNEMMRRRVGHREGGNGDWRPHGKSSVGPPWPTERGKGNGEPGRETSPNSADREPRPPGVEP